MLVGASVALGAWAVDAAADTEQVYVLAHDVAPGADLTAEGVLTLVDAHPGTEAYVTAGSLPVDAVATRSLDAGELLPTGAVGSAADQDLRAVVLEVVSGLPAGTSTGDSVELWVLPGEQVQVTADAQAEGGEAAGAELVAQGLTVAAVGEAGTSLIGGTTSQVEVFVPSEALEPVLTAVGQGGGLVLVPTGQEG
ncbi:MAG: hypothetical protein Q4C85_00690 [Actinomyces sp.]|uniref:hypothetical protein n=1 Tax=Actinomyces sp. TaxID=29317 RepID=UPI0026DC4AC8|nr:hypothetical protein [Actinomyces sp.]MDO4242280.1 hypothetical protein [Actinomyces sp.]